MKWRHNWIDFYCCPGICKHNEQGLKNMGSYII
jgi:hypothetical protein